MKKLLILTLLLSSVLSPAFAQSKTPPKATPVVVQAAETDKFIDKIEAIGTLKANETITLTSTVTETVTAVNFVDGQRVHKGDILVEMTRGEEKALVDEQKALVKETSAQLERARSLSASGAASKALLDQRQREYTSAMSQMAAVQSRLNDYMIVAPFDGIVGLRNISVGALLQPGTKITTLDDDSVMKLDFTVPSIYMPSITPGMEITARAAGFPDQFNGQVTAVDSQINEDTRAVTVRALLPNPDAKLKPGLLMTLELLKNPRDGVVIPEMAIIPEGRQTFVFVVDDKATPAKAEKREIVIGSRRPGEVEVVKNLQAGEKVVVQGTMMLRPDAAVTVSAVRKRGDTLQDTLKSAAKDKAAVQPAAKGQ